MSNSHSIPIQTTWAAGFDKTNPLPEYPRPMLVRAKWQNLNGVWDYAVTKKQSPCPAVMDGTIVVPYAIESFLSGVCKKFTPEEKLHYQKQFAVENKKPEDRVLLHFEAVDWQCEVSINGCSVGSHTGGYNPFSFDIADFLKDGVNELYVSVVDPTDSHWQQRGKQSLKPEKIWYTATSGIWQTVWLECVPKNHIESIKMTPLQNLETILVTVHTSSIEEIEIEIYADTKLIVQSKIQSECENTLPIPHARLWTPSDPFLYKIVFKTKSDIVTSYFGMRTVCIKKNSYGKNVIFLNDKPIFINGPLDQGYWPESGMTQPSDAALVFDIQQTKNLGFNMIRKHVKIESGRWYYHADRLGMLVIQDMPNGGRGIADYLGAMVKTLFSDAPKDTSPSLHKYANRNLPKSRMDFEKELAEMLKNLHNHPSIIIWGPFNESWGQYDSKRIYKQIKSKDFSRLVDHVSGWYDQGCGDFLSVHTYKLKLKSPPKDDNRAYLISEYGGYNYNEKSHLWRNDKKYGYKNFKSAKLLSKAYESLIKEQVLPLIDKGLCGVVYTQLCDVEIETNGLFTYDRKVLKIDSSVLKECHKNIHNRFDETKSV